MRLGQLFRPAQPVPAGLRANFRHLFLDIAWFGLLAASAMSFVAVFAARQGASAFQLGLLSASPALVNLAVTLPAGRWLARRPIGRAVFWSAAAHRLFYLFWVFVPAVLLPAGQVWALIGLTLLMSMPGTALAVGFNALFADAVPIEWRGYVAGWRNGLLAIVFVVVSLVCGRILERLVFPLNYQVVFGMGALGAVMSTVHLAFVRPLRDQPARVRSGRSTGDLARPGSGRTLAESLRAAVGLRYLIRRPGRGLLRRAVLRRPYARLVAVLAGFHLAVNLAIPLFPIHWVDGLGLTDQEIGLGTAVFYLSVLAGSTQLARVVRSWGNQRAMAAGALLLSAYPGLMALSHGLDLFLVASVVGGLGWSLAGGSLSNYLLEKIPDDDRPAHLAWYNLALNAALLLGSLGGPLLARLVSIPVALGLSAALRLAAAVVILRWE